MADDLSFVIIKVYPYLDALKRMLSLGHTRVVPRVGVPLVSYDRIHLIYVPFIGGIGVRIVILEVDRFCPLEIYVQFEEMSLLCVSELFQVEDSNDRRLFYRSF